VHDNTFAVLADGTVWGWGLNGYGQLGDGTFQERHSPVQVMGLTGVIQVGVGAGFAVALRNDGTVWSWGSDENGQLGDAGLSSVQLTPVRVLTPPGIIQISVGIGHTVALRSDGTAWTWGQNGGALGDGSTANRKTPAQVPGLTGVTSVAAGSYHTLALAGGRVLAWGANGDGQIGDGTVGTSRLRPVPVAGLPPVGGSTVLTTVARGAFHSMVLTSDGRVFAWGDDFVGELGDGATRVDRLTAVPVPGLTGVQQISGGSLFTLAVVA
jgi:alpha-tubulin suppressor-like RCC1 family protein